MHAYIHICVYHKYVFGICCRVYHRTSVVDTKYGFIISGRGENFLSQIAYLHQFIYSFRISFVHVLYIYTLSCYVSKEVK